MTIQKDRRNNYFLFECIFYLTFFDIILCKFKIRFNFMRYLGKNKNGNVHQWRRSDGTRFSSVQFNIIALICQKIYNIRSV